jgi:MoaA/NifB/PqqE/SkfB family radical SAM enzyme
VAAMKRLRLAKYKDTIKYAFRNAVSGEHKYPLYASFKVTNLCKSQCPYCDMWRMKAHRDLETHEIMTVLDNLAASSILVVSIEGGEPFLRDDIGDILAYLRQKPFYTELTTSAVGIDWDKVKDCAKLLDFLHISIDEGHNNLYLLDNLAELKSWIGRLGVQIIVRKNDLPALEDKVKKIRKAGAQAIIIPATCLDGTPNDYPDPRQFRNEVNRLIKPYANTIVTAKGYLDAINKDQGCDTASIIIGSDACLYYPCRTLKTRATNLLHEGLMDFVSTQKAATLRNQGKQCRRSCGWYQYFAVSSYYMPRTLLYSWRPYFNDILSIGRDGK